MGNRKKRIYISGPMTGIPDYKKNFNEAEETLKMAGWDVVNPAKIDDFLGDCNFSYDELLKIDIALLDTCDGIYMLEGWENSRGALIEKLYTLQNGKRNYIQMFQSDRRDIRG